MITPYDVPITKFIDKLAKYLKENVEEIQPPSWAIFAKTGMHVEKQPQDPDWWYTRSASMLRKVYVHGPIGLEHLRAQYGGRKDNGVKPEHAVKASGNIIRKVLQQLESAGLVQIIASKGRSMSPKGRKLVKEVAEDLYKDLVKIDPALKKYQGE